MARMVGSNADSTGPRIRAVAQTLIAKHGYAAVSMRQIAGEIGIQAGTIYIHFKDKQALLFDLIDGHLDDLLDAWRAQTRPDDPTRALRAFTEFHLRFHMEHAEQALVAAMELRNLSPENLAVVDAKRRAYDAELEAVLRSGHQIGQFRLSDVRLTTLAVQAMLSGASDWQAKTAGLSPQNVQRIYWRLVRRMVTGVPRD